MNEAGLGPHESRFLDSVLSHLLLAPRVQVLRAYSCWKTTLPSLQSLQNHKRHRFWLDEERECKQQLIGVFTDKVGSVSCVSHEGFHAVKFHIHRGVFIEELGIWIRVREEDL